VYVKTDAVSLLKADHKKVKALFTQFENAENRREKKKIVAAALVELKLHAAIEEEIFYVAVRRTVGKDVMNEADEEHHIAKILIAELESMDGSESHYDAKFTVLAENVRHHIKEEESEMLPKAQTMKLNFEKLGAQMAERKQQLLETGFPPAGEEAMVAAAGRDGDSPAKIAEQTASANG
jgi:hypothetical protein